MLTVQDLCPSPETKELISRLAMDTGNLYRGAVNELSELGYTEEHITRPPDDRIYSALASLNLQESYAYICKGIEALPFWEKAFVCLSTFKEVEVPTHPNLLQKETLIALGDFSKSLTTALDELNHPDADRSVRRCFYVAAYDWGAKTLSSYIRSEESIFRAEIEGMGLTINPVTPQDHVDCSDKTKRLREVFALVGAKAKSDMNAALASTARPDIMPDIDALMRKALGNDLCEAAIASGHITNAAQILWPNAAAAGFIYKN